MIWNPVISSISGAGLGFVAFLLFQSLVRSGSIAHMNPIFFIIGPIYGFWTAICARRFRPEAANKTRMAKPLPQ